MPITGNVVASAVSGMKITNPPKIITSARINGAALDVPTLRMLEYDRMFECLDFIEESSK
jgi:hypothetical protein